MSRHYESIRDVPDRYLLCMRGASGHDLDLLPLPRRSSWGQPEDWRCARCGKIRHDVIDSLGQISVRTYEKPDGYPTFGAFTTGDVRLEVARRARARRAKRAA